MVNFLTNIHKRDLIASLLGQGMVSVLDPASDGYPAWLPVIIYEISYNNGQHYNSPQL